MCVRYYVEPKSALLPLVERARRSVLAGRMIVQIGKPMRMTGEIRPTDIAAVLAPDKSGGISVFPMLWGFIVPESDAPIVNCRIETADHKPLWKDSWYRRRCVIPASWYYEWEHYSDVQGKTRTGRRYAVQPKSKNVTWLAGLYRFEERRGIQVPVFTVLTQETTGALRELHSRMPVVLQKEAVRDWIRPDSDPKQIAEKTEPEMVAEKAG